jgi:glycosyltransferase involved in cell wall biosynthesis
VATTVTTSPRGFKVLYVSPNHPAIRPGGLELYAQDLYDEARKAGEFEPLLLARTGPPFSRVTRDQTDSSFSLVGNDPNQYLFYTHTKPDLSNYDPLFGRPFVKDDLVDAYAGFLDAHRPDVVHFHHTLLLGFDILRVTRNVLPDVPIVYSLHEYVPICHRDGQMVRTGTNELCQEESPRRCHECFPEITPQTFYMRKRFIQSHLDLVDCFIVPSDYVAERYAEWGLPRSKLVVKPYSRQPLTVTADTLDQRGETGARNRFGYFGQVNPYKGVEVLLEAMEQLEDVDAHLWLFGANLEIQPPKFRERVDALLDRDRGGVTFAGSYERAEIPKLMARIDWVVVPSIWWETGPIVVWEAFQNGRPVICSDIGGMSEKVTDGVDGLHFRTGDAGDLARVLARAAGTPGLWDQLHARVPREPAHSIEEDLEMMTVLYRDLLGGRAALPERLEAAGGA